MEYLIGILIGIVIFQTYMLYGKRKPKIEPMDKRELEAQKHREEHLEALLNYDAEKAYGGKR